MCGSNLMVLAGILAIPMAKPMLSLVYAGALPSVRHFWHAMPGLIITLAGFFLAGWILRDMAPFEAGRFFFGVNLADVTEGGVFWAILIVASVLTAYWFTYHEALASLSSVLLGYLVLMPFIAAGHAASAGFFVNSLPLILIGLTRIGLALFVIFITTWILGFPPQKSFGTFVAILVLFLAAYSLIEIVHREQVSNQTQTPEPTVAAVNTATPVPPTATTPPPTATATAIPSPTPEPSPTPDPTATVPTYTSARVTAPNGLIVREGPSTSFYVLTYVYLGDIVQLTGVQETNQNITWSQIIAPDGGIGWISTRYLEIIKP